MSDDTPRTRRGDAEAPEAGASLAEEYEPGVDPAHAQDSLIAGPAARDDDGDLDSRTRRRARGAGLAQKIGGRAGVIAAAIVGVVAIVLFALAVPLAPAIAWIGIALEVALLAALAVSAFVLREGAYRRTSVMVITIVMIAAAILFAVLLLTLGIIG